MTESDPRIRAEHLDRDVYHYVRQSTPFQVKVNTESGKRQFDFRERARALGWLPERIHTIDDQGRSGKSTTDRPAFQRLVAEVSLGHVGLIMGLELSRLSRNNADWARLTELCAMTGTLILDEERLYDPSDFNDGLLLGFKGLMSSAELHLIRARSQGAILSKARRGELRMRPPIGYVYREDRNLVKDPDRQVQETVAQLFRTFARVGTATGTMREFRRRGWLFPSRTVIGPWPGELVWKPLSSCRVQAVLHNPRYTGTYVFGRSHQQRQPNGRKTTHELPREKWIALVRETHPAYIPWEQYEANLRRLKENARGYGLERHRGPPREGPALLQGLAVCGLCGHRMMVHYGSCGNPEAVYYKCLGESAERGVTKCQKVPGDGVDAAVSRLLLETMTPLFLETSLEVQREVEQRWKDADRLRRQGVERARYEAELARRRYMAVDPNHRLVAGSLEAEWNARLRSWQEAQELYERESRAAREALTEEHKARIRGLATEFPRIWNDPRTPVREKKRLVRLIVEDVTLKVGEEVEARIRFRGGATQCVNVAKPLRNWEKRRTPSEALRLIDRLLEDHTEEEVAKILNRQGVRPGVRGAFARRQVQSLRAAYDLRSRWERLRARGLLTRQEMAARHHACVETISRWRREGKVKGHLLDETPTHLYEPKKLATSVEGHANSEEMSCA